VEKRCRPPEVGWGPGLRWTSRRCARTRASRPVPLPLSRPRMGSPWTSCGRGRWWLGRLPARDLTAAPSNSLIRRDCANQYIRIWAQTRGV
jgi:hypothetical protein